MVKDNLKVDQKIKVCIIDDEKAYRDAIKEHLRSDKRVMLYKEYESGFDFIKDLEQPFQPDVCLIDIVLNDISGIDVGKLIKRKNPNIHIIFMTAYPNVSSFNEATQIGADYIEKGSRGEILLDKIIMTVESTTKEQIFSFQKLGDEMGHFFFLFAKELESVQSRVEELSDLQRKVLKLRKADKPVSEIAKLLNMSPYTVRTHINRGLKKLKLPNFIKFINL